MRRINNKTQHFGIFIYTPFSSNLLHDLFGSMFRLPNSLEEWGNIDIFHFYPQWHTKEYVEKLHTISSVTKYAFYPDARVREWSLPLRLSYVILNRLARFRWKYRFFNYPLELKLIDAFTKKARGYL
jgi:hypothetical protein